MDIYKPGTQVVLQDDIPAIITRVYIHPENCVQYECAWWNGRSRCTEVLEPSEIVGTKNRSKKIKMGFVQGV